MTLETALLSAVTAVTGALCYVARLLWVKSEKCEADRYELREEVEQLKMDHGIAKGTLTAFEMCPEGKCPFKKSPARYVAGKPIGETPS